jgi:RHS repeat-associated protein
MTYTASGQLYYTLTPTEQVGTYDYNWHWYDADGLRVMTQAARGTYYVAPRPGATIGGTVSYYVYDGSDVALVLSRAAATANSWWVRQRQLTGGVDQVLAGRYSPTGVQFQNLALVANREGSTVASVKYDGTEEIGTFYPGRNAFGAFQGGVQTSATNTETGFTGASTPNQTGGFTYLRNRWYDGATGRFLTQDPIGLAGGVNLYAYAGNNPVAFSDPFGLCKRPGGKGIGICLETYIKSKFFGLGDNRGPNSNGGSYKTHLSFSINPANGQVSGIESDVGSTAGKKGTGGNSVSRNSDGNGGWNLTLTGTAVNGEGKGPMIDYDINLHVSSDGVVTRAGGAHDGFPSMEIWTYGGGNPNLLYDHDQGSDINFLKLFGDSDTKVPEGSQ